MHRPHAGLASSDCDFHAGDLFSRLDKPGSFHDAAGVDQLNATLGEGICAKWVDAIDRKPFFLPAVLGHEVGYFGSPLRRSFDGRGHYTLVGAQPTGKLSRPYGLNSLQTQTSTLVLLLEIGFADSTIPTDATFARSG